MHLVCEVMELPVPNSLDAAAGAVVKSSHEITVPRFFLTWPKRCRGKWELYRLFLRFTCRLREFVCWIYHPHNSTVLINSI